MAPYLAFHPEALAEFHATVEHYERERPGLGHAFAEAVRGTTRRVAEAPLSGAPFTAGTRRLFVRRFPYAVVYAAEADRIFIIAVAHFRRRPGYWRGRR